MRITKAVKLHLRADTGVSAIAGQRVYLRRAPQGSPIDKVGNYVIVSMASAEWPTRSQARRSDGTKHVIKARVQVDSWSLDEDEVDDLAEAVSAALDDFIGTTQGVVVKRSLQDDERDNYNPLDDASDVGAHRITQDYGIHYEEPTT